MSISLGCPNIGLANNRYKTKHALNTQAKAAKQVLKYLHTHVDSPEGIHSPTIVQQNVDKGTSSLA